MTDTTPVYAFPFPEDADPPDGPAQFEALALALEAKLAAVDAAQAAANVAKARGAKAIAGVAPNGTSFGTSSSAGTTEIITNSVTFTAEADRCYQVLVTTPVLDNDGTGAQTAVVTTRWASGGSVANSDTLITKAVKNTPGVTGSSTPGSAAETVTLSGTINDPPAGTVTVGVGLAATSGTTTIRFLASGTSGPDRVGSIVVLDVGPAL